MNNFNVSIVWPGFKLSSVIVSLSASSILNKSIGKCSRTPSLILSITSFLSIKSKFISLETRRITISNKLSFKVFNFIGKFRISSYITLCAAASKLLNSGSLGWLALDTLVLGMLVLGMLVLGNLTLNWWCNVLQREIHSCRTFKYAAKSVSVVIMVKSTFMALHINSFSFMDFSKLS